MIPNKSWAEETLELVKAHATFEDIIELIALLSAYLEEESQKGIKQ